MDGGGAETGRQPLTQLVKLAKTALLGEDEGSDFSWRIRN